MHRNRLFILVFLLAVLLCLCSCARPEGVTVVYATPLPYPVYEEADISLFNGENPFGNMGNTFIFKGKIDRVQEINLIETREIGGKIIQFDNWNSICDVTVQSTLYGEAPDKKESVRVLFGQSSRRYDKSGFALVVGQEYYFITYLFASKTDQRPSDSYADAAGGIYYDIFPVKDGVVRYQGWKFEGAQVLGKKDSGAMLKHEDLCSIDEESFLEQFTAMIEEAKTKAEASTGPG